MMDCVVNRTLIPKNLNITIGKRSPCDYLSELKKVNRKLDESLEDHLIPHELITDSSWNGRFREFLDARAKAIMGDRSLRDQPRERDGGAVSGRPRSGRGQTQFG